MKPLTKKAPAKGTPVTYNTMIYNRKTFHTEKRRKSVKCKVCSKFFTRGDSLKDHMRIHTGDRPFECDFCGKCFNQKSALYVHTRIHTSERSYFCKYCDKSFIRKPSLKKHLFTHIKDIEEQNKLQEKQEECKTCLKKFMNSKALQEHMLVHQEEEKYSCITCDQTFFNLEFLASHECGATPSPTAGSSIVPMETNIASVLKCEMCPMAFNEDLDVKMHTLEHLHYVKLNCRFCVVKFETEVDLQSHIKKMHREMFLTPEGVKVCKECIKPSTKRPLYHRENDVFNCFWCRHFFNYNLATTRLDLRKVPYKCVDCTKHFSNMDALHEHMLKHSDSTQ